MRGHLLSCKIVSEHIKVAATATTTLANNWQWQQSPESGGHSPNTHHAGDDGLDPLRLSYQAQHHVLSACMLSQLHTMSPTANAHVLMLCRAPGAAPLRPRAAASRGMVSVEANLFSRLVRVVKAYVSNATEQWEDPEVLLDRVTDEMQEDLIKMRQATAKVGGGAHCLCAACLWAVEMGQALQCMRLGDWPVPWSLETRWRPWCFASAVLALMFQTILAKALLIQFNNKSLAKCCSSKRTCTCCTPCRLLPR